MKRNQEYLNILLSRSDTGEILRFFFRENRWIQYNFFRKNLVKNIKEEKLLKERALEEEKKGKKRAYSFTWETYLVRVLNRLVKAKILKKKMAGRKTFYKLSKSRIDESIKSMYIQLIRKQKMEDFMVEDLSDSYLHIFGVHKKEDKKTSEAFSKVESDINELMKSIGKNKLRTIILIAQNRPKIPKELLKPYAKAMPIYKGKTYDSIEEMTKDLGYASVREMMNDKKGWGRKVGRSIKNEDIG
ncbi:MAG: hypothetical protein KKA79_04500 [Nanoarchaeota archaeon]|nr:hypothetical protein [Nanoarchaeota archaeon]